MKKNLFKNINIIHRIGSLCTVGAVPMKKISVILCCLLLIASVLCGCNEHAASADLQAKEQLTVEDIITLLESKDLTIRKANTLPNEIELYQVGESNLLLLHDFGNDYLNRNAAAQEIHWPPSQEELAPMAEKVLSSANLLEYNLASQWSAKNILAYYIPQSGNVPDPTLEIIREAFLYDINGLQQDVLSGESEHFALELVCESYQTPLIAENAVFYEQYRNYHASLKLSAELMQKYRGKMLSIVIKGTVPVMNANLSIGGIDSDFLELDLGPKKEFVGESWENPLSLTAVITVGETTEEIPLAHAQLDKK